MQVKRNHGFTLIEMLLSVALLGGILAIGAPVYNSFLINNNLNEAVTGLVADLRYARTLSMSVDGDSIWGVRINTGEIVLFKGATYVSRDASFDQITNIATNITSTGDSEITFKKLTGLPNATTSFTFQNTNNQAVNVSVNNKGLIDY